MVAHGFPADGGPIAVMLHEHDEGRAFIRALAAKATQDGEWTAADRQEVAANGHGYSELLHAHIHKEDAILYPMALNRLPDEALADVSDRCAALDAAKAAAAERLVALAEELVARHARAAHPDAAPPDPMTFRGPG
jgi:hemerythrin-like domain-containing protein